MAGYDGRGIERALGRTWLSGFTSWTWPQYQWNWHHKVTSRYLDALAMGQIRKLMVFMPPRHGKSELASRRLPAYYLGRFPDREIILTSYAADLASRMNRDVQRIIDSPRYAQLFPETRLAGGRSATRWKRTSAKRTDSLFEIVGRKGGLRSSGVRGGITGMGFRLGIIDDPYKNAEEALSSTIRNKVEEEYRSSFLTRQAPDASILLMGTRWHHDDLFGVISREQPGEWEILSLPAISGDVPKHPADEREHASQALWPGRFDLDWLAAMRKSVGSLWWSAMYDQEPTPEGGNLFRRQWFGRYRDGGDYWLVAGRHGPVHKADCMVFASVDPSASEKQSADYTAIVVGALTALGDVLILHVDRERLTPDKIPHRMAHVARQWDPQFYTFEDNGFQIAVVQAARRLPGMPPIREVGPQGKGKVVRATPAIVKSEAGQVFVPEPGPDWLEDFFDELERFRGEDETNDQVDAFAYLINQCPRMIGDRSDKNAQDVAERVSATARESQAGRRGLWGRIGR